LVSCLCKSTHIPHAYNVLSSQAAGQNIYISRLPNIHHKENGHFPLTDHEKEIKNRKHKYINFIEEKIPLDSAKILLNFMGMKIRTELWK